jgi:hypothetical protein
MKISGLNVRLDSLHIGKTYAGMLEGLPTKEQNTRILGDLEKKAAKTFPWGMHKPVVIQPTIKKTDVSHLSKQWQSFYPDPESLPKFYVFACLDGPETDGKSCGASALLIFFAEDVMSVPLEQVIQDACKDLSWKEVSFNYDV